MFCPLFISSGAALAESSADQSGSDQPAIFIERVISDPDHFFGWSINKQTLVASPDGEHFAFYGMRLDNSRRRSSVVRDGESVVVRKEPIGPIFSPDSQHLAYFYSNPTGQWFLTVDHHPAQSDSPVCKPIFSPDSQRVAYWARVHKKIFFVDNGNRHHMYEAVRRGTLKASPGSERWAYVAKHEGKWCVVVNDIPGPGYEDIGDTIAFSPDNARLAYWAKRSDDLWVVVVNGKEVLDTLCRAHAGLVFSPDSSRFAYFARRHADWILVVNDKEVRSHQWVDGESLIYSPDSRRLAYVAGEDSRRFVVIDGKPGPSYQNIHASSIIYSPDSRKIAFIADVGDGQCVVVDQSGSEVYDSIQQIAFSPDSDSTAWVGERDGRFHVIINGIATRESFKFIISGCELTFVDNARVRVAGFHDPETVLAQLEVDLPRRWAAVDEGP